ncbi:MAG: NHL repeat-containing protein [Clostridia bacterium]|nr:NHL repeat-containing protein [Clostridia bacterium]
MKTIIRLISLLLLLALPCAALAAKDGYHTSYTYNYDYWGDIRESPDAYKVNQVLYSSTLGLETPMRRPQSLFVRGNMLYVCDTGNNRILEIAREGDVFTLVRIIDSVSGTTPSTFNSPSDVAVDEEGCLYVCDTQNNRVIKMDAQLNFIREYTKPDDSTFDQNLSFLPRRLAVDSSGRVFVLATNVNKGIIKYDTDGSFTGFTGANPVSVSMWDYVWKMFFTTKAQRAQQESFVPTEYENICIDKEGFLFATNTNFEEYDLLVDGAKPIRRLNSIGNDILIKNDHYAPVGDLQWVEQSIDKGPSKFKDITVFDNGVYVAFDRTRGRLFGYDPQGIMLWAFGNKDNSAGSFLAPVSLEHMGQDLLALDENGASITVFSVTQYGSLIYEALDQYLTGQYDESADTWSEVLRFNANYSPAYVGMGRAMMRQENYGEAMDYFKMAFDRENYGRAYRYFRKELVEDNIVILAVGVAALLIVPLILGGVKGMKREVEEHERKKHRR